MRRNLGGQRYVVTLSVVIGHVFFFLEPICISSITKVQLDLRLYSSGVDGTTLLTLGHVLLHVTLPQ